MKRFFALVLVVGLVVGMALIFTGCGEQELRNIDGTYDDVIVGDYHCSKFFKTSEYLKFLEDFDHEENEILFVTKTGESNNMWEVTWKEK